MEMFIMFTIIGILVSLILCVGVVWANDECYEALEMILSLLAVISICLTIVCGVCCICLIGVEGDNRELFAKQQQEYIVINQYIKSKKSDSILESQDMMNRIKNYNDKVIQKQTDMTRPFLKYWAEGANWNELQLIDLSKIVEEEK